MNRNLNAVRTFALIATFAAAPLALADHNSPWGEDWATDAMDVHDARFDSLMDDTVSGNDFLADSLLDVGPGSASMGGMGGGMVDVSSGGVGGSRR